MERKQKTQKAEPQIAVKKKKDVIRAAVIEKQQNEITELEMVGS